MIAYDKTRLENTFFLEGAQQLREGGFITREQLASAQGQTPALKTHRNLLVRAGFFLLGSLLYSSISGVVSLFVFTANIDAFKFAIFLYALIGLAGSEFCAKQHFFAHGLDDGFMLGFVTLTALAVGDILESVTAGFLALALAGALACLRYVHTLCAVLSFMGVVGFFCALSFDAGIIPKFYLPIIGLAIAMAGYAFYHFCARRDGWYRNAWTAVQVSSLVLGYVSANYFVVRELSVALLDWKPTPGSDIPLAWLFYALTIALPVVYIGYSIRLRNKPMLWIGVAAWACSALTFYHYFGAIRPEWALVLAGLLLFAIAVGLIRRLRHKESGVTFEKDRHSGHNTLLYAQAVLVNSQIDVEPTIPQSDLPFGGGGFSGGGSEGSY